MEGEGGDAGGRGEVARGWRGREGGVVGPSTLKRANLHSNFSLSSYHCTCVLYLCICSPQELLGIIELDRVTFDLFHLPPLTEYELYVKKFGADNTRQVH